MVAAVDSIVAIPRLWSAGVIVVAQGLSCSMVCGIFLGQGSNPCLLHWQADFFFLTTEHQASPWYVLNRIARNTCVY